MESPGERFKNWIDSPGKCGFSFYLYEGDHLFLTCVSRFFLYPSTRNKGIHKAYDGRTRNASTSHVMALKHHKGTCCNSKDTYEECEDLPRATLLLLGRNYYLLYFHTMVGLFLGHSHYAIGTVGYVLVVECNMLRWRQRATVKLRRSQNLDEFDALLFWQF